MEDDNEYDNDEVQKQYSAIGKHVFNDTLYNLCC